MARPRAFDWDEARARRAAGETYAAIARSYGVTDTAVIRACNDDYRRSDYIRNREWTRAGRCPDCGTQTTRVSTEMQRRCRRCAALAAATSVRADTLRCVTCREWKPDEDFPHNRQENGARRGRHSQCRSCQTIAKRKYRAKVAA